MTTRHSQSQPFHDKSTSSIFKPISKTISLLLAFSLLLWALIRHGQLAPNKINHVCANRTQQTIGFIGDSDFYGLGIRLGVYLQWTSSLVTNFFTPTEREAVITTYTIFSISLTIAILVRVFDQQCTFAVEMFVVLTMFWGGLNVVLVPMLRAVSLDQLVRNVPNELDERSVLGRFKVPKSLRWSSGLLNFLMSPIAVWFWGRLAAVGEQDFAATPGGSALYFFARIEGHGIKGLSIFMAVVSALNFIWFSFLLLPLRTEPLFLCNGVLGSDLDGVTRGLLNFPILPLWLSYILMKISCKALGGVLALGNIDTFTEKRLLSLIRFETVLPALIALWCIIGIELALYWNSVSGIYTINTTGQVIPFVTGLGVLSVSIGKSVKKRAYDKGVGRTEDVEIPANQKRSSTALELDSASCGAHVGPSSSIEMSDYIRLSPFNRRASTVLRRPSQTAYP